MKKLKLNLFAIAALAIAAVTMSFEMGNTAETTWHYTSNSTAVDAFANAENWQQGAGESCLFEGNKPCEITVNASSEAELSIFLSGMSNSEVLAINPSSRRN